MIKSVMSRVAVIGGVTFVIIALPVFLLSNSEKDWFTTQSLATSGSNEASEIAAEEQAEEPVIQVASLSLSAPKPKIEVLDFSAATHASTAQYVEMASELAKQRKFVEALETLDKVQNSDRNTHSVKFLEARILSWHGKHDKAEREFETLREQYPHDMDVLVSFGYLHFYQRNYVEAEQLFVEVLDNNPDYHDARRGLERSRTAHNKK